MGWQKQLNTARLIVEFVWDWGWRVVEDEAREEVG